MSDQQYLSPEGLRQLATKYRQQATSADGVMNYLKKMTSNVFWQSDAATSFKQKMNDYQVALQRFRDVFNQLATELDKRAEVLEVSQSAPV